VVAARLGLTIALVLVVVTEMVGNPAGLGYALVSAQQSLQPEQMWAYLIVTGVLGALLQSTLNVTARTVMPGFAPQLTTGAR
jgi:NitT/TauT family transport system permease protein